MLHAPFPLSLILSYRLLSLGKDLDFDGVLLGRFSSRPNTSTRTSLRFLASLG